MQMFDRLSVGRAVFEPDSWLGPRVLSDYELVWIRSGQVDYVVEGRSHLVEAGQIILGQPGRSEKYVCHQGPVEHEFFHFTLASLAHGEKSTSRKARQADQLDAGLISMGLPSPEDWPTVVPARATNLLAAAFGWLHQHWPRALSDRPPTPAVNQVAAAILALALMPDQAAQPGDEAYPQSVQRALVFAVRQVRDHPENKITLNDLAKAAHVSPKHLCRVFTDNLQVSPMHALRAIRLEASIDALVRTNQTIQQVAFGSGFASAFHYSRVFSETYGQPPTAVRQAVLQGASPPPAPAWLAQFHASVVVGKSG